MPEPLLFDTERNTLRDLTSLLDERAKTEEALKRKYDAAVDAAQRELTKARRTIAANREKQTEAVTASHGKTRAEINERYENEQTEADRKFRETAEEVRRETTEMERKTLFMHVALLECGVLMVPLTYPSVKQGEERLRVNITRGHTQEDMDLALEHLKTYGEAFFVLSGEDIGPMEADA